MASLLDRARPPEFTAELDDEFPAEFGTEFEADPPSAAFAEVPAGRRIAGKLAPTGAPVSAAMRRKVKGELELFLELLVGAGEMACEPCAAEFRKVIEQTAERGSRIVARYPHLAEKLIGSNMLLDWVALGAALRAPVQHVIAHHVTHSIGADGEGTPDDYAEYGPYRPQLRD